MSKLSKAQIDDVRKDFMIYVDKHAIWQSTIAKETGYSASVISQWRNGTYKGDYEKVARDINNWMERHARRRRVELPVDYVPTQVAEDMRTIAHTAMETGSMAAIVVPSGCGKTMVLQMLAEEMRGHYVYCDGDLTPRLFLMELASAAGLASGNRTVGELKKAIIDRMKGTNRPILLDEAHQLRPELLSRIRSIHDQTGVSVIMAGTDEIFRRIDDRADGRGQMSGRCLRYSAMEHVFDAEDPRGNRSGRPLFTREEIKQYFANMAVKIDRDAFELLWAIACLPNQSCLRTVRRVVQLIVKKFEVDQISRKDVVDALPLLIGQAGNHVVKAAETHRKLMAKAG